MAGRYEKKNNKTVTILLPFDNTRLSDAVGQVFKIIWQDKIWTELIRVRNEVGVVALQMRPLPSTFIYLR